VALVAQYTALVSRVAPASVPRVVVNDADQGIAIVTAREVVDRIEARLKT
jgi:hypothetical protein